MLGEIADIVEIMPKARRKREFYIRNNYYLCEGDSGNLSEVEWLKWWF